MMHFRVLTTLILLVAAAPARAQQSEVSERARHEAECRLAAQS